MATSKRRADLDERPSKKVKSDRSNTSTETSRNDPTSNSQQNAARTPLLNSVLQQEDRAFPRGGASVLTPIEYKQIKAQAEHDVLFEQHATDKSTDVAGDTDLLDSQSPRVLKKKRRDKKGPKDTSLSGSARNNSRINGLSYKALVPGSTVLGCISAITSKDLALSLPNNLTGFVPIAAVSNLLNARIERMLASDDSDNSDGDLDLSKLFYVGQWLRATVTASGSDETSTKNKRHIELSIDPKLVNDQLTIEMVAVHGMIQAAVRSVEDRGIVMDLGLSNQSIRGFVSKKELGSVWAFDGIQEGQVMMCLITGKGGDGKILKLSPDPIRFSALSNANDSPLLNEASSIEMFVPGTATTVLLTSASNDGIQGVIMGMLDVSADAVHSSIDLRAESTTTHKIGSKVKARIIYSLLREDGSRRVGISILDHMLVLPTPALRLPPNASAKQRLQSLILVERLQISSKVDNANVVRVEPDRGIYLRIDDSTESSGSKLVCFAHISQISDKHIESLSSASGPYALNTKHTVRIIKYSPTDGIYYVCMKKSVLDQPFLRLEDLSIGQIVKGRVDRLLLGGKTGITGIIVKLGENVTGLVPEMHMSDTLLQHPERKFKDGLELRARVLSIDLDKRRLRLTLKKSLMDITNDADLWKDYADLKPGMHGSGTIINILPTGAVVQFFGSIRAWLPVAEMSETFVESTAKHLRIGQTVQVRILSVDVENEGMKVSCKTGDELSEEVQPVWDHVSAGDLLSGIVTVKSNTDVSVDLDNGLRGTIKIGHLTDGGSTKAEAALQKMRVGQKLVDLLVIEKAHHGHHLLISVKKSLTQAAKLGTLPRTFDDLSENMKVHGFVRNITPEGVYVEFVNRMVGLLPKSQIPTEMIAKPAFGLIKDQTVHAWVLNADRTRQRFTLTLREHALTKASGEQSSVLQTIHPVEPSLTSTDQLVTGKVTKARITAVKRTQLNVQLAENVNGRVDVSEIFREWDAIPNSRFPLQHFKSNDIIDVKVLGLHDARNHRYLPISHRQGKNTVYELSMKRTGDNKDDEKLLTLESLQIGSSVVAFVNNHSEDCIWVNVSPNVRGRISLMELNSDVGDLQNVEINFPIGAAIRANVKSIDVVAGRLDFTAFGATQTAKMKLDDLSPGAILPARITKLTEKSIHVQLNDAIAGPVPLVEISDDYDNIGLSKYSKNDIVRVCIIDVDVSNKRLFLSLRPSKTLSSNLPVKDRQITRAHQLRPGDIIRGFVKHIAEKGVFVALGACVDGFVRISDLSDSYVKDWKSIVHIDQLVQGRVLKVEKDTNHILLSLKTSHTNGNYQAPLNLSDLHTGMIVSGKVRKVEDFGAFVDIDNTQPRLSGLCHRSEVAAKRVDDVRKLYSPGDLVKAMILTVDQDARKISLGLKASYFEDVEDDEHAQSGGDIDTAESSSAESDEEQSEDDGGIALPALDQGEHEPFDGTNSGSFDEAVPQIGGLQAGGFDWNGKIDAMEIDHDEDDSETDKQPSKKGKRSSAPSKDDLTGDLDKFGPRSVSDFERQLLGQPNLSELWIQYMAFQLQMGEVQKARGIADRALRTIHMRDTDEKANIWIARLNLEVEYGDDEAIDAVFKDACQVQDALHMHQKLASIFIESGKHAKAEAIFDKMIGNKTFRANPDIWLNYATFLMNSLGEPVRARALLQRAMQSIPSSGHRSLTASFAALEFHSAHGDTERGRTIFEGLVSEWPKWTSVWDMWVDLERSQVTRASSPEAKSEAQEKTRALYVRMSEHKMKKRRAKFLFKRWLEFEEQSGGPKDVERVKSAATTYVELNK